MGGHRLGRAARPCPRHGCPHLQPCPAHPRIAWAGSDRAARLPANWPFLRKRVLKRDGYRCTWIEDDGRRCLSPAIEVDHINRYVCALTLTSGDS